MSEWQVAALLREAEQTRNDGNLTAEGRLQRLEEIRAQVVAAGGDGALVGVADKPQAAAARATRSSKPAAARRKAGG